MNSLCEKCKKRVETEVKTVVHNRVIKGDEISVIVDLAFCKECGEEVYNHNLECELDSKVYAEYRKRHKLLSPQEITAIYKKYGLNAKSFARLLNMGDNTIYRYEDGSLQEYTHDALIKMISDPFFALRYLEENETRLSESEMKNFTAVLNGILLNELNTSFVEAFGTLNNIVGSLWASHMENVIIKKDKILFTR